MLNQNYGKYLQGYQKWFGQGIGSEKYNQIYNQLKKFNDSTLNKPLQTIVGSEEQFKKHYPLMLAATKGRWRTYQNNDMYKRLSNTQQVWVDMFGERFKLPHDQIRQKFQNEVPLPQMNRSLRQKFDGLKGMFTDNTLQNKMMNKYLNQLGTSMKNRQRKELQLNKLFEDYSKQTENNVINNSKHELLRLKSQQIQNMRNFQVEMAQQINKSHKITPQIKKYLNSNINSQGLFNLFQPNVKDIVSHNIEHNSKINLAENQKFLRGVQNWQYQKSGLIENQKILQQKINQYQKLTKKQIQMSHAQYKPFSQQFTPIPYTSTKVPQESPNPFYEGTKNIGQSLYSVGNALYQGAGNLFQSGTEFIGGITDGIDGITQIGRGIKAVGTGSVFSGTGDIIGGAWNTAGGVLKTGGTVLQVGGSLLPLGVGVAALGLGVYGYRKAKQGAKYVKQIVTTTQGVDKLADDLQQIGEKAVSNYIVPYTVDPVVNTTKSAILGTGGYILRGASKVKNGIADGIAIGGGIVAKKASDKIGQVIDRYTPTISIWQQDKRQEPQVVEKIQIQQNKVNPQKKIRKGKRVSRKRLQRLRNQRKKLIFDEGIIDKNNISGIKEIQLRPIIPQN